MTSFDLKITNPRTSNPLKIVLYELEILNACFPHFYVVKNKIDENIRLEAFLLHARNLIYFLEGCCREDDIKCTDFIDNTGKKIEPLTLYIPEQLKDKINKHLQHLSKMRLEEKVLWPVSSIAHEINRAVATFADQLSPEVAGILKEKILHTADSFLIVS